MRTKLMLAGAAIAALVGGAAYAQSQTNDGTNDQTNTAAAAAAQSATAAGSNAAASSYQGAPMAGSTSTDSNAVLVTNGPVPDTPANRKLYGGPMSNAGRHTAHTGD